MRCSYFQYIFISISFLSTYSNTVPVLSLLGLSTVSGCCGNGVCEAGEDIFSCNSDCAYSCGAECKELSTTFAGGNGSQGNYFKVQAVQDVVVTGFTIHTTNTGTGTVKIYEKAGDYVGHEQDATQWNEIMNDASIVGAGSNTVLPNLEISVVIPAGTTRSFYIWTSLGVRYTNGSTEGNMYVENQGELQFYEGKGSGGEFGGTFSPRVWNGIIEYGLEQVRLHVVYYFSLQV